MSDVIVRPVEAEDFPQWLPLWNGYNAFYGRSGAAALPDAVTQATWARFQDPAIPIYAIIAVSRGVAVGLAHYLFHYSTSSTAQTCYLQDLFTSETMRGQGVARALIEGVYAAANQAGTTRVYWHTHETNHRAQALYDKVAQKSGFIVYRKPA
ncbi:GNAT family N-acetyltransferase [Asticcacaulis sp. 201]|uniref:GNAT family N-acetyltransferase n=1 Tax=Asticcacaulis sp. 201 TaxID=3028787 RepID=UPI00291615AA|nr:GNAT family N-acetyltransferase [Asticcacaulis sp. 201]MDV6333001.1 GNAT family N-acetyltransferase [Asticcacaulis sp. 201]